MGVNEGREGRRKVNSVNYSIDQKQISAGEDKTARPLSFVVVHMIAVVVGRRHCI